MVSVYPCAIHGGRTKEPLAAIRITCLRGRDRYTRYMRVCLPDLYEVLHAHEDTWDLVGDEGLASAPTLCRASRHSSSAPEADGHIFAYVWERGRERRDFYGILCGDCCGDMISTWGLLKEDS
jgi:hypothetical protein